jgi:mycofactocin precursor
MHDQTEPTLVEQEPVETSTSEFPALVADEAPVADELLVEDVSIDGMCGVY